MQLHMEKDFAHQQAMLVLLQEERKGLADGSQAAQVTDTNIKLAENLIASYEVLKWYEH